MFKKKKADACIAQKFALKDGSKLVVRQAEESDAEAVLALLIQLASESDMLLSVPEEITFTVEEERAFLCSQREDEAAVMLCAWRDGDLVGIGSLAPGGRQRIAHVAELSVSVKKSCWNLGVGNVLMQQLIAYAKQKGQTKMLHLGVRADNIAAVHLYEKHGFLPCGAFKNYFKVDGSYRDELLMSRMLF